MTQAFDYLEKPFDDVYRVRTTVGKALERRRLVLRNRELEEELRASAWLTCEASEALVFGEDLETKWESALRSIGVNPAMLSSMTGMA